MSTSGRKRSYDDNVGSGSDDRKMPAVETTKISESVKLPEVGMTLDVRDADYIWAPARVVRVDINEQESVHHVTIHYLGWNDSYDERIAWNSERLAPLYSFTKQVKCLVDVIQEPKGNSTQQELDTVPPSARQACCNLWPCAVQLRMPHPTTDGNEEQCLYAELFLKEEQYVFVQPYASHLLPMDNLQANKHDGGQWVTAKRLKPWPSDSLKLLGVLSKKNTEAFQVAFNDSDISGVLTDAAFEKASLLKPALRVHSRAGARARDGSLQEVSQLPARFQEESPVMVPPGQVQAQQGDTEQELTASDGETIPLPPTPVPPPSLPPPIEITDLIYPDCGVKRCQLTNQWTASICVAGNELFLGSFPTQTQAYQATRVAAGDDIEVESDLPKARLADLRALPIETVIDTVEKKYDMAHQFSLRDYTMERIKYEASQVQQNGRNSESVSSVVVVDQPRRNKRKGRPRRVDLDRHCYVG